MIIVNNGFEVAVGAAVIAVVGYVTGRYHERRKRDNSHKNSKKQRRG